MGRHQSRNAQTQLDIEYLEVSGFIGVGQMATVPSEEVVHPVITRKCKMSGVGRRILRHQLAPQVRQRDFQNVGFISSL